MKKKRSVYVPGEQIDGVSNIVTDVAGNTVVLVPCDGKIIAVFVLRGEKSTARLMSEQQAVKFANDLRRAHESANDDLKIEKMEEDFKGEQ